MGLWWWLLVAIALIVLYTRFQPRRHLPNCLNPAPQSPHWIPFLGSIIPFAYKPENFLSSCVKKCVFLHGPEAAEYYLRCPETELSFLQGVDQVLGPFLPVGLFRRIRNDIFSLALRKPQLIDYISLIQSHLSTRVTRMGDSGSVDVFELMSELTLELNGACFAGEEINTKYWARFVDFFHKADPQTNVQGLIMSLITGENKCEKAFQQLQHIVTDIIADRVRHPEVPHNDYLENLIRAVEPQKDGNMDVREITMCLYGFLLAAQVNTYAVMGWTLTHLLRAESRPFLEEVLKEQDEIRRRYGDDFSLASLDDMQFLEHCIMEAARLEIIGSTFRLAMKDTHYAGYDIPKGDLVCLYTASVHHNEMIFTEPKRYDPFRFLEPREEHKKHAFTLLMFGGGPHACLGKRFVTLELKSVLATLFRQFDMSLVSEKIHRNPRQVFFTARPDNTIIATYTKKKM